MIQYILCLSIAIFVERGFAADQTGKILDGAYMNALDKHYQQAVDKTFPLLDNLKLNKITDIVLAHQILSLSYCELGKKDKALEHLKALRAFSKTEDFRVFNPSPPCKELLEPSSAGLDKPKKESKTVPVDKPKKAK